jgi:putative nucleotidyltransferase with HDIG domain
VLGAEKLSSVPLVYARLNTAISSGKASATFLGTIIGQDTALTARLLKLVNSPFYGFPGKIDTIPRAVMVVGTQQLRDLAIATTVMDSFKGISSRHISIEEFWKHSVACGITARIIAGFGRQSNVEKFFVAGLLHDVGRLVMFQKIPELCNGILEKAAGTGALMLEVEQEVLGFDHATVGGALIRSWRLPANIETAVAWHHAPGDAVNYTYEASVVHIADVIVHAMEIGSTGEHQVPECDDDAWDVLGLPSDGLARIFDQVDRQFNDVFLSLTSQ